MSQQPGMDQNTMNSQMMMQQMARANPMMNMPNLNDASGNLNQMMQGYNQNMGMNPMMNQASMGRMQGGNQNPMGGNFMGNNPNQMNQNDPTKQVSFPYLLNLKMYKSW